ncbi:MAG: hypothetical protein ACFB16_04545 [Phormidesmis sp.]
MTFTIQKLTLSTAYVVLAAFAVNPMAKAAETNQKEIFNIHQIRTEAFDIRVKSLEVKPGFNVHDRYISGLDSRNKGYAEESNTAADSEITETAETTEKLTLQQRRIAERDRRNKEKTTTSF